MITGDLVFHPAAERYKPVVGRRLPNLTSQGEFLVTWDFIFLHHRD